MVGIVSLGGLSIAVDSCGTQLLSLKKDECEYLWQRDAAYWGKSAPVLFPNIGVVPGGEIKTSRGVAHLQQHGIARWLEHELVSETDDSLTYRLESSRDTKEAFPFDFVLETRHKLLDESTYELTYHVENSGESLLPFNIGNHGAYNVPFPGAEDEEYSDYEIRFVRPWSAKAPVVDDDTKLMDYSRAYWAVDQSDRLGLSYGLFDHDNITLEHVPENTVQLVSRKSGRALTFRFDDFAFLALWTPTGGAPFLSVQPWTGHASEVDDDGVFEHKAGTVLLRPGESAQFTFSVSIA